MVGAVLVAVVGSPTSASDEEAHIHELLDAVPDPEVPAISIVDLGIVRRVRFENGVATVTITPTYSGCPAMHMITENIRVALNAGGFEQVVVESVLSPAWTTDWMSSAAKEKLRAYGIAPPQGNRDTLVSINAGATRKKPDPIPCPYCDSKDTKLRSEFGPTACKALYSCNGCLQPFEYFKPL